MKCTYDEMYYYYYTKIPGTRYMLPGAFVGGFLAVAPKADPPNPNPNPNAMG